MRRCKTSLLPQVVIVVGAFVEARGEKRRGEDCPSVGLSALSVVSMGFERC